MARTMARTLEELYRSMSYREMMLHEADYRISPWGERRKDLRAGQVAAACLAPHVGKGKAPTAEAFVLYGDRQDTGAQTLDEMKAVARGIEERHRKARERKQRGNDGR